MIGHHVSVVNLGIGHADTKGANVRSSRDDVDSDGVVRNGFDYDVQVWVENYVCLGVGSGRVYVGQDIRNVPGHEVRHE